MWSTILTRVFGNGWYAILTLALFAVGVSIVLLVPNYALIKIIWTSEAVSVLEKINLITGLYGSISAHLSPFSAFYTLLLILLFSINITLLVFYIRRSQVKVKGMKRTQAMSIIGMVSGVLGVGCAACGSVILFGLATSLGATGLLVVLPLHGGEFALIGILLLGFSIRYLVRKIHDPLVCPVG